MVGGSEDKPKPASRAKKPAEPDPPANTGATQAQASAPKPAVGIEEMRRACGEFIAGGPDKDANRAIINTQIWPKYGVTELAKLKPEDYAAAFADLQAGPGAYQSADSEDMGV